MSDVPEKPVPGPAVPSDAQPEPTIPDGGLGEAMPEWLRRPPAWRGMPMPDLAPTSGDAPGDEDPETDSVAGTASSAMEPEVVDHASDTPPVDIGVAIRVPREIPAPDVSPIDPSSLIEFSDLPPWLVDLGKRDVSASGTLDGGPALNAVELSSSAVDSTFATGDPSVPLPPFLRDQAGTQTQLESSVPASDATAMTGMSRRILMLGGVLLVVTVIAILIAVFG